MSEPFKRLQHRVWTWNFAGELHMGSKDRQRVIEYMFRNCQAGLIGFQEVTTENVEAIRRIRSDWRLVVHPAKPYMTPIAYNHHRYALKNSEIIYFSDDKTEKVSWGADTTRSGVLAEFFDGETHRHFLMVNLHLDNVSAESRKQSINMVIDRLQSYRSIDTQDKLPIIVTGDFNMSRQVPEDLLYTDGDPEKPQYLRGGITLL